MKKYWLGNKNFPQRKLFPDEIFPDKVHLTFMKVLNKLEMHSLSVFFNITKVADFWLKNAGASRTQEVCHVIYIFFRSYLGKL